MFLQFFSDDHPTLQDEHHNTRHTWLRNSVLRTRDKLESAAVLCTERHYRFCVCNKLIAYSARVSSDMQILLGNTLTELKAHR